MINQVTMDQALPGADRDLVRRLLAKVEATADGCLLWTGARIYSNYGLIRHGRKARRVHRVSYELFVGAIPAGHDIEHSCHTRSNCDLKHACPHRACVAPQHLRALTHHENLLLGTGFPAAQARQTHCKRDHPLSGANLYVIPSTGARSCRRCKRDQRRSVTRG